MLKLTTDNECENNFISKLKSYTLPRFPRSNDLIEEAVRIRKKKSQIKALQNGKYLLMVLLNYRIQPSQDLRSHAKLVRAGN